MTAIDEPLTFTLPEDPKILRRFVYEWVLLEYQRKINIISEMMPDGMNKCTILLSLNNDRDKFMKNSDRIVNELLASSSLLSSDQKQTKESQSKVRKERVRKENKRKRSAE